ncbi:MAG: hypothetical protein C0459_02705 [Chitinophaga sp.]|jgi:FkbM family methyltransferase|nr:hypothetical protein [Chitinophaga sp.]
MIAVVKKILKKLVKLFPVALTKNEYYNRLTKTIIQQHCKKNSVCVDAGSHKGEILQMMLDAAPNGIHYAFEPIQELINKYLKHFQFEVNVYAVALSNNRALEQFNLVKTNTAYSGLRRRFYDRKEKDTTITVQTDLLDNFIQPEQKIDLIKLDIEGGELWALQGAVKTIQSSQPLILFEFGKAAVAYDYDDKAMFQFINETINYRIYTLRNWLNKSNALTENEFHNYYEKGNEYFFVAAPFKPII